MRLHLSHEARESRNASPRSLREPAYLLLPVFSHSESFAIGAGWGEQESKE